MIKKAIEFVREKHKNQLDDNGENYVDAHLVPVSLILNILNPNDSNLTIAGLLHDTLEDTNTTYKELKETFNKDIADLVLEMTHKGKKDEKGFYFPNLKSDRAIIIKLIDRASNISRMQNWDEKRKEQYLRKTKFWRSE
jgi:(p)ppGpp synthase/HD superfamily hydrolase